MQADITAFAVRPDFTGTPAEVKASEREWLRVHGIVPLRTVIRSGVVISYITQEAADAIILRPDRWEELGGAYVLEDRYTVPGTDVSVPVFVGIDNQCGCCFVEDFLHESACLSWLTDSYTDTDETICRDAQRFERELDGICPFGHEHRMALIGWINDRIRMYGHRSGA